MTYDIYGHQLAAGHCEVHPDVQHPYPCPCCYDDSSEQQQPYPEPCQGCYYADGEMKVCDGTCERLPMAEWEYFKQYPDQLPPASNDTPREKP